MVVCIFGSGYWYLNSVLSNNERLSFSQLAKITCGWHLKLDQFASIVDFLTAICYREQSMEQLQAFEEEVKGRGKGLFQTVTYIDAAAAKARFSKADFSEWQLFVNMILNFSYNRPSQLVCN